MPILYHARVPSPFLSFNFPGSLDCAVFAVIFGAGAFENSVLLWSCEHRSHPEHMDHDDAPYCITKGLFYAHMGSLMFKLNPLPSFDNVADLKKDPILVWQDRHIHLIAVLVALAAKRASNFESLAHEQRGAVDLLAVSSVGSSFHGPALPNTDSRREQRSDGESPFELEA